jgi:hypothetical protein
MILKIWSILSRREKLIVCALLAMMLISSALELLEIGLLYSNNMACMYTISNTTPRIGIDVMRPHCYAYQTLFPGNI